MGCRREPCLTGFAKASRRAAFSISVGPMRTPGSPLATSASALVAEANAVVPPISIEEAAALLDDESVLFVDIREPKE